MRIPFVNTQPSAASTPGSATPPGEQDTGLPLRLKEDPPPEYEGSSTADRLQIHPVPSRDAVVVKIQPPRKPERAIEHVPCDVVLVIDVSYSMGDAAPVPGEKEEDNGLSILDLVKHATNTIIETCNDDDRVGIVTFSNSAETVLPLTRMTRVNKKKALKKVKELGIVAATNLWGGIHGGLSLFEGPSYNVPAVMVLTDGLPNHMCPPQGYVPKLSSMMPLPATIHTFGFGYNLDSGLLKSIAEIGGGNYGFIPDAGMIGTVFNHAVANLQSTYATEAVLRLTYAQPLELAEATGRRVDVGAPEKRQSGLLELTLPLGNLQFGQSRDVYLRTGRVLDAKHTAVSATLEYKRAHTAPADTEPPRAVFEASADVAQPGRLSEAEIAFHESRAQLCSFIQTLFKLRKDLAWTQGAIRHGDKVQELESLILSIPATSFWATDKDSEALMEDICGEEPSGQIQIAVGNESYLDRWGRHYLLSYVNAHTRQICNSFKDQGPQRYGVDSPLFRRCLAHLDDQFDKLPPPKPSRRPTMSTRTGGKSHRSTVSGISISRYNSSSAPCFAGYTAVELASGRTVSIRNLRRGMRLRTPLGPRRVAFVLKTPVEEGTLCRVGSLLVTPWHPISLDGGKTWDFPADAAHGAVRYTGSVYSVMLQRDTRSSSHAIRVEGAWGVTLGHGMTAACDGDIRGHAFWGDWNRLGKEMVRLGTSRGGVVVGSGVQRDESTGLVSALK